MRSAIYSAISGLFLAGAAVMPAAAADMGIPVPVGATSSCSNLALVCENGRTYPICPIAISVAGELVTGRLVNASGGAHIRLIPMGDGYRYAGRGVWFDGKYSKATLFFSQNQGTACDVVGSSSAGLVSAKY